MKKKLASEILVLDNNTLKNIAVLSTKKKIAVLKAIFKTSKITITGLYGSEVHDIPTENIILLTKRKAKIFGLQEGILIETDLTTG